MNMFSTWAPSAPGWEAGSPRTFMGDAAIEIQVVLPLHRPAIPIKPHRYRLIHAAPPFTPRYSLKPWSLCNRSKSETIPIHRVGGISR